MGDLVFMKETEKKNLVKQDLNFLEYPLWFQDVREKNDSATKTWKDSEGYTYSTNHRLPTKVDAIILYYLLLRSQQEGWKERVVLSRREILTGCGMEWGKRTRLRLKDALDCLESIRVNFSNGTFYDGYHYTTLNFHIVDTWGVDENTGRICVMFSPEWFLRLKASCYFRFLDFGDLVAIGSPLAMRLYELLAKAFHMGDTWEIDAFDLAKRIPMKETRVASIVFSIKKAADRINACTGLGVDLQIQRPCRGQAIFVFRKERDLVEDMPDASRQKYESLMGLIPANEGRKKAVQRLVIRHLQMNGSDYVKRNILYANGNAKKNYRLFLQRSLEKDWGSVTE